MEKQYYISKEQFLTLKAKWKESSYHSAADHIIYNILRSKPADNGFIPKKLHIQGDNEWYAFNEALWNANHQLKPCYKRDWVLKTSTLIEGQMEKEFKTHYGIEPPADLADKLKDLKK